jgi:hypothetical protein
MNMSRPKTLKAKPKRPARFGAAPGSAAFSEPPPNMDVNRPEWAEAFTEWWTRKCATMDMDPIEGMARCLGLDKEADEWRKRRQAELRHREKHSNDIYGKPPNDQAEAPEPR